MVNWGSYNKPVGGHGYLVADFIDSPARVDNVNKGSGFDLCQDKVSNLDEWFNYQDVSLIIYTEFL